MLGSGATFFALYRNSWPFAPNFGKKDFGNIFDDKARALFEPQFQVTWTSRFNFTGLPVMAL